jgi:hypothetical protein
LESVPVPARRSPTGAASVSEIHRYPPKPGGVAEPLWETREWKKSVADHLAASRWLCRASEIERRRDSGYGGGQTARATDEPVYILVRDRGSFVVRCAPPKRSRSWRKRRIVEVHDLWREVRSWWSGEDAVDRLVARVLLAGGLVVDLAQRRLGKSDEWTLVGIED